MKRRLFLLLIISLSSHALTSLDDLLIKNNTGKTVAIVWFINNDYTQKGLVNLMSPALLAPKGQTIPGTEPYFPNTDSKSLKKKALREILQKDTRPTGALFFDVDQPDQQLIVKFDDAVTGTVKRDGQEYKVNAMTLIEPPAYAIDAWNVVKGYDVQPADYAKNRPQLIGRR